MIDIVLSGSPLQEIVAEGYVLFCWESDLISAEQRDLCARAGFDSAPYLERVAFSCGTGVTAVFNGTIAKKPVYIFFIGLGSKKTSTVERREQIRRAVGQAIRQAEKLKITSLVFELPHLDTTGMDGFILGREIATTVEMASYQFNQFITDQKRHVAQDYYIVLKAPEDIHEELRVGVETGIRIGHAVNQARHWCDLPALYLTPTALAERAQGIADAHDCLSCRVFDKKEIEAMGMGGLIAVSQGSIQEPRFVVLEYTPEKNDVPTVGLVGKGVTFDSGGLSIKPAARMDEMKDDMAGAAAVITTMLALAYLKPHIRVVACAPITENLPSGTAIKPGDIIYHYNGKTSEIKNTDAEGRLILADALAYLCKNYKLDALVNIATLTGSCAAALGPFFAGIMSKHEQFQTRLIDAGRWSGDRLWPLPFIDDYRAAIKSEYADVCNIGSDRYRAGAITAGFFLSNFVDENIPWAHLDIAGTSFEVPDRSYYRGGSTGFGVRLFVELLTNWK